MADLTADDGWHLVVGHPAMEIREEKQMEEWERSKGHWSGCGKHPANWVDHKTLRVLDRELGVGSYGVVERITYGTVTMARKHVKPRRGITVEKLREEANAMERLVHKHILKLVGTYTLKRNDLFLLLYPAAVCDLSRFLDDIDDIRQGTYADREDAYKRLRMLNLQDVGKAEDLITPRENGTATGSAPKVLTAVGFLQQILGCVTEALAYVHEKDIRHRDLKPKNILLSPGRVYLADFGIARDVRESEDSITSGRCGTPFWIAPEVHDEQDHHMSKADIWSLGCVFLNIATLLYGETLARYDEAMKEHNWTKKYENMEKYLARLRHKAKEAALHHPEAPNLDAKHILGLVDEMLRHDPVHRPSAKEVNARLSELGGLDQIYHLPCCHKKSSYLSKAMNNKLKIAHDANAASVRRILSLETENAKLKERLYDLETIYGTYEQRIENERRHAGTQYNALKERYDRELEARKALEERIKAVEHLNRGPPRRPRSQNRGRGRSFGSTHLNGAPNVLPTIPTPQNRSVNNHPIANPNLPPSPSPSPKGPLRTSRVPKPVRPSTPMRPSLSRGDPGSTSSTMLSSTHSTFSRASMKTEDSFTSVEDGATTLRSEEADSPLTMVQSRETNAVHGNEEKNRKPWEVLVVANGKVKDVEAKDVQRRPAPMLQKQSWANLVARSTGKG